MMRRHHENRIKFDFPGMENKTSLLSQLKPSPPQYGHAPPFVYHETAVISLGKSAKPKKSFILIKNKPLRIALLFAKV